MILIACDKGIKGRARKMVLMNEIIRPDTRPERRISSMDPCSAQAKESCQLGLLASLKLNQRGIAKFTIIVYAQ